MADRPTTPHYGIAKYGPHGTQDPMDVYTVYNEAMETIDRILFDLQGQIAKNKQAIIDLDAKVERYNTAINKRIDELDAKVENYNTALNNRIDNLTTKVGNFIEQTNQHFTTLDGKTDSIWAAIRNIIGKAHGGGTVDTGNGSISWGDGTGKLAIGTINLNSGSGYIRTHDGTLDNDLKAV